MKARSKVISGLLMTAIMISSFGGGYVYAENYSETGGVDQTAVTSVSFTQNDNTYTISIPEKIELKDEDTVTEEIAVTESDIRNGYEVKIGVDSSCYKRENGQGVSYIELKSEDKNNDGSAKYTLYSQVTPEGSNAITDESILVVTNASLDSEKKTELVFGAPVYSDNGNPGIIPVGTYKGTVVFNIECVAQQ